MKTSSASIASSRRRGSRPTSCVPLAINIRGVRGKAVGGWANKGGPSDAAQLKKTLSSEYWGMCTTCCHGGPPKNNENPRPKIPASEGRNEFLRGEKPPPRTRSIIIENISLDWSQDTVRGYLGPPVDVDQVRLVSGLFRQWAVVIFKSTREAMNALRTGWI